MRELLAQARGQRGPGGGGGTGGAGRRRRLRVGLLRAPRSAPAGAAPPGQPKPEYPAFARARSVEGTLCCTQMR